MRARCKCVELQIHHTSEIVMKTLLGFSLLALVAVDAAGVSASAQTYPTRPVTFVVPFAPGGGTEFLARLLGQRLEQRLGKPLFPRPFSVNSPARSIPGAAERVRPCRKLRQTFA